MKALRMIAKVEWRVRKTKEYKCEFDLDLVLQAYTILVESSYHTIGLRVRHLMPGVSEEMLALPLGLFLRNSLSTHGRVGGTTQEFQACNSDSEQQAHIESVSFLHMDTLALASPTK